MSKLIKNTLSIALLWVIVMAAGIYVTYMQQPEELDRLDKAVKVEEMKRAEVTSLLEEAELTETQFRQALAKWQTRYKEVPDSLSSSWVVGRFNDLTPDGFKNFDVRFGGNAEQEQYNYYTHHISGRGYFTDLYDFIWKIENTKRLHRIRDLTLDHIDLISEDRNTGRQRMQVMVSFQMDIESYYGGAPGLSAPEQGLAGIVDEETIRLASSVDETPVPREALPDADPDVNPFFPGILSQLPPNTYDRVNVDSDPLVSIVGNQAIFKRNGEFRTLSVGSQVYLGQIISIDPLEDRVVARINKGGVIDQVDLELGTREEAYRQAIGSQRLAPSD